VSAPAGGQACAGCARVAEALAGRDPWLIAALPHGVLLLGDHQAFEGYAVLWSRVHVEELHHLDAAAYAGFMADLKRASQAVEKATQCLKLNTVSLGNVVRHAHVHLFPRAANDPQALRHPWVHEERFTDAGSVDLRRRWVRALQEALA
jgi:diadenosine tetraphosphate (Ap4A) HIT family hydrolase